MALGKYRHGSQAGQAMAAQALQFRLVGHGGLRGHRLASLRAVTVFPEGHPLARLEQVGLAQLAEVDVRCV